MNHTPVLSEQKEKPALHNNGLTTSTTAVFLILFLFVPRISFSFTFPRMEIGFSFHDSLENGLWEKSFPAGTLSDGTPVKGVSRLEYEQLAVVSLSVDLALRLFPGIILDFAFSPFWFNLASFGKTGTDSDYLTAAGYWPLLFSQSRFSNKDRSFYFQAAAKIILLKNLLGDRKVAFFALAGYLKDVHEITMTEGVQIVSDNSAFTDPVVPPAGSVFPELKSTYQFNWDTVRIGFGVSGQIFSRLEAEISPSLLYGFYSGEGYWNLRTQNASPGEGAWRNESPNFIHKDAKGAGFLIDVRLIVHLSGRSRLKGSYHLFYHSASGGSDTIYFYDSSYNNLSLGSSMDDVKFIRHDISFGYSLSI